MASNRKDTLPKTLASIEPILKSVSSELIVTDTGCDEELLGIIRKYTDKIVKFQWCQDFAKARNVGLHMAKGKWFMFIDDDEWFDDVAPVIDFFNTKECDKYNVFHYIVRNYENMEGTKWFDKPVERGIRLDDDIEFEDRIHEHFSRVEPPIKLLSCYVHHYGYVYKTPEDRIKHSKRNMSLLLELVNEEPTVVRHYVHLIQEYNTLGEYEKSLEMAWKGLKNADKNDPKNYRDISSLLANVVLCEYQLGHIEDAIKYGERILREEDVSDMGQGIINSLVSDGYLYMREYTKAFEYIKKYFTIYERLIDNVEKRMSEMGPVASMTMSEQVINSGWYYGIYKALAMDDEEALFFIMDKVKYVTLVYPLDGGKWQGKLIDKMQKSLNKDAYVDTVLAFMGDVNCATAVCGKLLELKNTDEKVFMDLVEKLVNNTNQSTHIKLLRTIYYGMTGDIARLRELNGEQKCD